MTECFILSVCPLIAAASQLNVSESKIDKIKRTERRETKHHKSREENVKIPGCPGL